MIQCKLCTHLDFPQPVINSNVQSCVADAKVASAAADVDVKIVVGEKPQ